MEEWRRDGLASAQAAGYALIVVLLALALAAAVAVNI